MAFTTLKDLKPSFPELMFFIVFIILIVILSVLIHYHFIQKRVQKESRCLRERKKFSSGGVYSVEAHNPMNLPLYRVDYDFSKKEEKLSCNCKKGDTINTFTNIPFYDLNNNIPKKQDKLLCYCDKAYDSPNATTYYKGHPGLIRYMQNNDASFFSEEAMV